MADLLNINSCYVSAIENGKKGPPSKSVLQKLITELGLDEEEQVLLWDYVDQSKRTIRLPDNATAEEYSLMRDMQKHLGSLSIEQIMIIQNTLKLGGNTRMKPRIEIRSLS